MPFRVVGYNKPIDDSSLAGMRQSVLDLVQWTTYEFQQIASALVSTEAEKIWNSAPPKPRRGTIAYADGTNWNPGSGEGPYFFDGTSWHTMRVPAAGAVPAMVLLETASLAGLTSYSSTVSWAGYSNIKLVLSGINSVAGAAAGAPIIQYHSGGAYQTANYMAGGSIMDLTGTAWNNVYAVITTGIPIYGAVDLLPADIPQGISIDAIIFGISSTTMYKHTLANSAVLIPTAPGHPYYTITSGVWTGGVGAIDGIKLIIGNGTVTFGQGILRIYGMT